jgi:uncharacterized membrane protein YraQ (UPF0718 family)
VQVVWLFLDGAGRGLRASWQLLWASLYGLTLGFLMSAVVQVVIPQRLLRRYATGGLRGIAAAAGFGAISSSCSYGSAAATRSLYRRGADARAAFSFLISSTNMNIAILVMFWTLVGWKFAFAELFGGAIIIAVVAAGLSVLFPRGALDRLRDDAREGADHTAGDQADRAAVPAGAAARAAAGPSQAVAAGDTRLRLPAEEQDAVCGMTGSPEHAVAYRGREYRFCSAGCAQSFAASPARYAIPDSGEAEPPRPSLTGLQTWYAITARAWGDVKMLRTELIAGYLLAGFAEALIPRHAFSQVLHAVGAVPVIGYVLLLLFGLAIAVATFVCSMGNVPVARFLKAAGVPLGANTAYIYGDLLHCLGGIGAQPGVVPVRDGHADHRHP